VEGPVSVSLVALRCRTSDRTAGGTRGVEALAPLLGKWLGREPRMIGTAGEPRAARYEDDLRDSRGCLLEAGGQVDDALSGGNFPLLLAVWKIAPALVTGNAIVVKPWNTVPSAAAP
jgi:arginase